MTCSLNMIVSPQTYERQKNRKKPESSSITFQMLKREISDDAYVTGEQQPVH